jgi:hypothetical protein
LICKTLKKLSNNLQPYGEVVQVIIETCGATEDARVLRHVLAYAQFQYGERIPGKTYRQRGNGERIDNYRVEIDILIFISRILINAYQKDKSLASIVISRVCHSVRVFLKY